MGDHDADTRALMKEWGVRVVPLFMIVVLGDWVKQIPMAALVAIMIMVSIGTFSWSSIRSLAEHPWPSSVVMVATVVTVVLSHNLAIGVLVGVLLSGIFFAWKMAQIFRVTSTLTIVGFASYFFGALCFNVNCVATFVARGVGVPRAGVWRIYRAFFGNRRDGVG